MKTKLSKVLQEYHDCEDCATAINWPGGRAEVMKLYGTPLLCEKDPQDDGEEN